MHAVAARMVLQPQHKQVILCVSLRSEYIQQSCTDESSIAQVARVRLRLVDALLIYMLSHDDKRFEQMPDRVVSGRV